jgi:hypothetical protein
VSASLSASSFPSIPIWPEAYRILMLCASIAFCMLRKAYWKEIGASSCMYRITEVLFIQSQIRRLLSLGGNYIALDRPFYTPIASASNT